MDLSVGGEGRMILDWTAMFEKSSRELFSTSLRAEGAHGAGGCVSDL